MILSRFFPPILAGQSEKEWRLKQQGNYGLQTVRLENVGLAKELEEECKKKGGVLTYGEYLQIEQFGKNGYHASHSLHGMTDSYKVWEKALFFYCKKNNIHSIVEFGCGDGKLARVILKEAKKQKYDLSWDGVEVNSELREKAKASFEKEKLFESVSFLVSSLDQVPHTLQSLLLFSYSLDSVQPEIVLSKNSHGIPDAFIGVEVKNGKLKEVILTASQLRKKGYIFEKGQLTNEKGISYDLREWSLQDSQRLYIPIHALTVLHEWVQKFPIGSHIFIMDEFRRLPSLYERHRHYGTPVVLYISPKERYDFLVNTAYKNAGNRLFYYPFFLNSYYSFLQLLGFVDVHYGIEEKIAKQMMKESWKPKPERVDFCYALFGKLKEKQKRKVITVQYLREVPQEA